MGVGLGTRTPPVVPSPSCPHSVPRYVVTSVIAICMKNRVRFLITVGRIIISVVSRSHICAPSPRKQQAGCQIRRLVDNRVRYHHIMLSLSLSEIETTSCHTPLIILACIYSTSLPDLTLLSSHYNLYSKPSFVSHTLSLCSIMGKLGRILSAPFQWKHRLELL